MTSSLSTLIDVIVVSNGVSEVTISDHFLVYLSLHLMAPKTKNPEIITRSFKNYVPGTFSSDISKIPWDVVNLSLGVYERLNNFN